MRIESVDEPGAEWDAFVTSCPGATLWHAAAWARVMREAYGLEPEYLAARDASGELSGVLPLVHFRALGGRREIVSLPFLDGGGILARGSETVAALRDAALARCRETGARALELRQGTALGELPTGSPLDRVDLVLRLEADEEAQWKALRAKVRNQTRKATREGLTTSVGSSPAELDAFYQPFGVNMRDLGSPVHARRLFESASRCFGESLRFVVTRLGEGSVGGLVAIRFGDTVSVPWASTLRSERRRCPNNLIYWEALRWAIAIGAQEFDFGRSSRGSGSFRFKRGWGAEERSLAWVRLDPSGRALPGGSGEAGGLLRALSSAWTRLPVGVANAIGPRVRGRLSN